MVGCALLGLMLDSKRYDQRRRAQMGFAVVVLPSIAWFCWLCVEQQNFLVNKPAKLDWTSAGWASAYIPFFLMQIWGYLCQTYSACCSLLSSSLGRCWEFGWADGPSSPPRTAYLPCPYSLLARLVLLLLGPEQRSTGWGIPMCGSDRTRCVASFGDPNFCISSSISYSFLPSSFSPAVSYGINSHASNRFIPLGINFGLLFLAIPGLLAVVQTVPAYRSLFQEGTPEYEQEKIDRAASDGKA